MDLIRVPEVLRERLGDEACAALVTMLRESSRFSVDAAVNRASERFERRLAGELTKMRLEFGTALVDGQAALRKEFTVMYGELRKELHDGQGALRKELTVSQGELRKETMSGQAQLLEAFVNSQAALREERRAGLDRNRTELLRWSFGLWTGQVVVVLAILALMTR